MGKMTSVDAATVTIDRGYFDTLVRRAHFNSESLANNGHPPLLAVTVSRGEYDSLQAIAKQYENLRRNLLRGGVGEETVDLLSQDDHTIQDGRSQAPSPSKADVTDDGGARLNTPTPQPSTAFLDQPKPRTYGYRNGNGYSGNDTAGATHKYSDRPAWADHDAEPEDEEDVSCDSPVESPGGAAAPKQQGQKPQFVRQCMRTIQLQNLAEGITHADITSVVRGGMVLDVFLRAHERSATVSFLDAMDAKRFYDHVRKHDLYIKNKRVDIKWSDRQFILPGHVAGKIGSGASRNLVIRRYDGRHTEENIREDLDHIHNLIIVKIEFLGGTCYLSLNSVHNAIYARQCMMSRFKYKGTKIEWDVDECAQPLEPPPPPVKPRKENAALKKAPSTVANRFHLLHIDDGEEDEIAATFQSKKSVGIAA
ncbi:hypothetical protein B0T24DRAFT_191760 [Lasiosphaeria ovina]|uniref:Uncharacterized protein n=1 Tax=Lasiosphaeria ovina TaxID=92902 RepID=A0AAE0NF57_9PEZI|nr:hypothetical protein B0T24DRAFT_191760 [Lasiosphaeria ovina]